MIALAVISIAMIVLFYAFQAATMIFSSEMNESDSSFEAHKAIERIVADLRNSPEIITHTTTEVTFWYQDANNNSTREASEVVSYTWLPTTEAVYRGQNSASVIIANRIIGMSLTYDNPSDIGMITIKITSYQGDTVTTLESSANLRNL
jgi:hypothetical protein